MEELISFDSLFEPVKANPVNADRLFGWDSQGNVNAAFTILGLKNAFGGGDWNTMANKPPSFTPSAHSLGSHSNVAAAVDGAADGTIIKKVAGVWTAVIPNYADTGEIPDVPSWVLNITETQKSNWDEAYGWGDHASAGYITGFVETDPVFSASPAAGITALEKANWNTAFGWGNHATVGYLTAFVETDPVFQASAASDISIGNIGVWNAKATEFSGLSDNSLLLLSNGVPSESGILAAYTPNPYDPITEEEDYDAFEPELLNFTFPTVVKGVDAVDADDLATLGQIPVLFDEDLEAIANAAPHGALNPFATMSDLFSRSVFDLLQDGATDGQAVVWNDVTMRWEPGSTGASLPPGGSAGQVLKKQSSADGDADWEDESEGGGSEVAAANAGSRLYLYNNY